MNMILHKYLGSINAESFIQDSITYYFFTEETMKTAGIVVEYNPLHNGHIYHLAETKKATSCDAVVAVMSGNFVQRGEPGFLNKWARTKMALKAGVDIVLELPVIYATSSAEGFAFGAVSTLESLGIVDYLCFGSEAGDVNVLSSIAEILANEPQEYRELLRHNLKAGLSFPVSRQLALTEYANESKGLSPFWLPLFLPQTFQNPPAALYRLFLTYR
jgi:predicted nucleotidyltransferase